MNCQLRRALEECAEEYSARKVERRLRRGRITADQAWRQAATGVQANLMLEFDGPMRISMPGVPGFLSIE